MPSTLPDGEAAPASGELPESALRGLGERPFGFYVHVPFCVTRCGYCDFNTYTAAELGPGASQRDYADTVLQEVRLARRVLGDADLPVQTVFFGGGTPTLLPPADLTRILAAIDAEFGLAPGAEVTTEANPESVDPAYLESLREGGFTRVSFGMQSAREHVLKVLDRHHTPGRAAQAVQEARKAGFEHVNLDLIYSTPGESDDDWRASLAAAVEAEPDHVSAYSLIVEDGTRLAARIRRGELPMPDDDVAADRYQIADAMLAEAGSTGTRCRTGPRPRRPAAGTTCSTGPAATGGPPAPAPTATWAAPAGGTSSTRPPTPSAWPPAPRPRTRARCSPTRTARPNASCWSSGWCPATRSPTSRRAPGRPSPPRSRTVCCDPRRSRPVSWCSP